MEGHCSTGQSPQWAVVPMEEEIGTTYYHTLRSVKMEEIYLKWRTVDYGSLTCKGFAKCVLMDALKTQTGGLLSTCSRQ